MQVIDPTLPLMSEEFTPGTPQMLFVFHFGAVRTLPVWLFADYVSVRYLIDEAASNRLPYKPHIRNPGDVSVIGGNGEALDLKCFAVLPSPSARPLSDTSSESCPISHLKWWSEPTSWLPTSALYCTL